MATRERRHHAGGLKRMSAGREERLQRAQAIVERDF
jgi:hypothetical protein